VAWPVLGTDHGAVLLWCRPSLVTATAPSLLRVDPGDARLCPQAPRGRGQILGARLSTQLVAPARGRVWQGETGGDRDSHNAIWIVIAQGAETSHAGMIE
jgi:hypothetical protein